MTGIKNKSGGSRANTGGVRAGAGRPLSQPIMLNVASTNDPLEFLRLVMVNGEADIKLRIAAAMALMPYVYVKKSDTGKKEEAAKKASAGRFASIKPPIRLIT